MPRIYPLTWHPKKFRPGDLDNSGSERLLGNPKLSRVDTLVREMAQNTWDARMEEWQPSFHMRLREGSPQLRSALKILLRNDAPDSPLAKSLAAPRFHVLEIVDRGTSGLDGPVDMSVGHPSNFQDLILKVGVPRTDDTKGGGTFGFGKTAAYAYSRIGTILYWTRCLNQDGQLEHRFIVSAFRDRFEHEDVEYTGRHWWGATNKEGEIAPIVGDEAQRLGEIFFDWDFPGDETGTSMLILDPPLRESVEVTQEDSAASLSENDDYEEIIAEWANQARHTIRRHLWPKFVKHPLIDQAPMDITLTVHDREIPLENDPPGVLQYWAQALNAVRVVQDGGTLDPKDRFVSVREVTRQGSFDGVTKKWSLGHLAIVERIPGMETVVPNDDLDPITRPDLGRVVRMRNVAELVVNSRDYIQALPHEGMDWLAVYKPTPEFDDVYAEAEPPAHDDWVSEGLSKDRRLTIQHTDRRIKEILQDELLSKSDGGPRIGARVSTAKVSQKLAALIPAQVDGSATKPLDKHTGIKRSANEVSVRVISHELIRTDEKVRQVHRVTFQLDSHLAEAEVLVAATFDGADGAREKIQPELLEIRWENARGITPGVAIAPVGPNISVYLHAEQGKAVMIDVNARALNGNS